MYFETCASEKDLNGTTSVLNMINNRFLSEYGNEIKQSQPCKHHSHMCFIIPEYMNKQIVEKGTKNRKNVHGRMSL